jgi:hypothetical protein
VSAFILSKYRAAGAGNSVRTKSIDNINNTADAGVISMLFTEPADVGLLYNLQNERPIPI